MMNLQNQLLSEDDLKKNNMSKRVNKTKEEIAHQMKNQQEIARKRKIIVEGFFPALVEATVSVDEAKMLIQAMSTLLMESVLKTMKERKFSEIEVELLERLCPNDERKEEVKKLLSTITGENLFVSREIIEGMTRAIDTMILNDMKGRKLDTLNADWDKFLN